MGCLDQSNIDNVASLIPLKPLMDDDGRPYVPLMYKFPFGDNLGVNQDSALVRPFHRALREGKPIGTINYAFYQEDDHYFVLGSFTHTPGGKIIFFPVRWTRGLLPRQKGKFCHAEFCIILTIFRLKVIYVCIM